MHTTLKDIAHQLNLSVTAVSRALRNMPDISKETKALVNETAARMGYKKNLAASYSIEFYDNKIVVKSGVINQNEDQSVFSYVYSVSLSRTFFGRLFNYGSVRVDCPGRWDIDTEGIKDPIGFKKFLEGYISNNNAVNIINN